MSSLFLSLLLTLFLCHYSGILRSVVKRNTDEIIGDHSEDRNAEKKVQLIMSTATLTKAVRLLLNDVQGGFNIEYSGEIEMSRRVDGVVGHSIFINWLHIILFLYSFCSFKQNDVDDKLIHYLISFSDLRRWIHLHISHILESLSCFNTSVLLQFPISDKYHIVTHLSSKPSLQFFLFPTLSRTDFLTHLASLWLPFSLPLPPLISLSITLFSPLSITHLASPWLTHLLPPLLALSLSHSPSLYFSLFLPQSLGLSFLHSLTLPDSLSWSPNNSLIYLTITTAYGLVLNPFPLDLYNLTSH